MQQNRTNPADQTRSGPQASQPTPPVLPGPSGLGQLTLEMVAAINTAVTQALQAATATTHVQLVTDSQVPVAHSSVPPRIDLSTEVQPATEAAGAVHGECLIGTQDNASISKNTSLSEAISLSNLVPEKVKNQICANEFIDFSLLLKSNISNTDDDQYTIKFETNKGDSVQWCLLQMPRGSHCTVLISRPQRFRYIICCNLYRERPERHPCTDEIWLCHPGACHLGGQLAVL